MKITQCEMIEEYITEWGSIMKKRGHKIKSEMVSVATRNGGRTHIARYSWADDNAKFDRKECEGV